MGKKTSTSTSQVSIPPEVLERYNAVNKRAEEVAANPFQKYGTTAEAFVAPINEQQRTGIANVNAAAGSAQPYIDAATVATTAGMGSAQPGELEIAKYMNPYQQQVIDATMRQLAQSNEQAQSGALGTAISSGAFGGDRAGIAAANLANQQGMAMGSTLAGLNAQNYGQAVQTAQQQQGVTLGATQADLARFLQGGGQLANLGVTAQQAGLQGAEAQINAGTLEQQTEQAGKTALVNQFMQEQGYPFQVAQFLANIALGTGTASGSTTTTTQPTPFFSDRRLKEDVKRIGKTDDGLPIYSFKYKGDDAEQTHVGFMADEVEKVKPEAVGLHPSGYKTVDYAKATENSMGGGVKPGRAGQAFAEGGVAGPYGSRAGSQVDFGGYVPQAYLPVGELMMADPALMDASDQNVSALMERSANFGANLQELDEQFGKDGSFWDMFRKQRASGGAAYLRQQPTGGLVPNSMKTYLSDTLESQGDAKKHELKTAEGGGGGGKSPAENIADFAKMGMMLFGFRDGGRIGYADGGTSALDRILAENAERNMPQAARERFNATPGGLGGGGADRMPVPETSAMDQYIADRKAAEAAGQSAATLGNAPSGGLAGGARAEAQPAPMASPRVGPTIAAAEALRKPTGLIPAAGTPLPNFSEMSMSPRPVARPEERPEGLGAASVAAPQPSVPAGTSAGWSGIAPNIIARESGGDFDALYGFSNREGGPFEGVKITDMTVDQAIDFSRPGGEYANWSKAQLGYTATPMGGLQIVGTTLRDIKDGMGLTGDEVMTPELQMAMGEWLYNNRGGEAPWAASAGKGPAGAGGYAGGYSGGLSRSTSGGEGGEGGGLGLGRFLKENAGNKDFLLSVLSGLGTMASSPSLYLGSAMLQGIGGAANTYMAREQQQANIRNIDASAMETTMRTAKDSIFPVDGVNMIMTNEGLVPFWDFMESGSKSTGNQLVDDMLRRIGQSAQSSGMNINEMDLGSTISVPSGVQPGDTVSVPSNVMWTDASQTALAQDRALMSSQPGLWSTYVQQTAEILPVVTAERSAAVAAKPNVNELATVVANSIANDEMGTAGNAYAQYIVAPLKTLARSLGVDPDLIGSDADANRALLSKLSTLSATDMTPDQQRAAAVFQQVAAIYPDLSMPPEAAAAITASVMLGNQADIDRANYYNAYLQQQPTGRGALVNADAAFAEEYSQLHQTEKANITSLFLMASDETPVGDNGMTKGDYVRKFLSDVHSGTISQERAQEVLNALLGPKTSPALSRYFVKGM